MVMCMSRKKGLKKLETCDGCGGRLFELQQEHVDVWVVCKHCQTAKGVCVYKE